MVLRNMGPKRLWSTGSTPKTSSKKKMPYPQQIEVDEEQMQRDQEREELEFWKEKALKLEEALEIMEDIVTLSEQQKQSESEQGTEHATRAHSAPTIGQSSSMAVTPPPSPQKTKSKNQRKDEIVQHLVTEMERIIESHTNKAPAKDEGDDSETSSENTGSNDTDPRRESTIDTSGLEDLVRQALDFDKGESGSAQGTETKKSKAKAHKHKHKQKPKRELYQLSCKHCIGQNFVGSTKSDLTGKVKEHFAVIWNMVVTAYGKGGGFVEGSCHEHSLSFRASSFSHHIAEHCQDCDSEDEVYQWCLKNVKVERISKHSLNRHDSI